MRTHHLRTQEGSSKADVNVSPPGFKGKSLHACPPCVSSTLCPWVIRSVVDEDVNATATSKEPVCHTSHVNGLRDVGDITKHLRPEFRCEISRSTDGVTPLEVDKYGDPTSSCNGSGVLQPEQTCAACDNGYTVGEIEPPPHVSRQRHQKLLVWPPSATTQAPVTKLAASLARNTTTFAISSGDPNLRRGTSVRSM